MLDNRRLKIAIQFLKEEQSFAIGNLRIGFENKNTFFVTGWTQYLNLENLTKKQALLELEHIKELFQEIVDSSKELKDFIKEKNIKFNLAFNYGMGSIGVCSEKNGVIKWEVDIQK
ncbi:hypothetical protein [Arachidicoccus sp.]|uniref:hypothetical protein n=1 Tax=Arachidicoccus sp. TaxID=1872624 RepID=UPI003D20C008